MSDDLDDFWIHTVRIEAYLGQDDDGADIYGAAVPLTGFLEETNRIVRTANGSEAVSTAQLYAPAGTDVPLDSRVALPGRTRPTQVLSVSRADSGALGLPDHVTLNLE